MIGIRLVRVPRCIKSRGVKVRAFRLTDLPTLARLFREETHMSSYKVVTVAKNLLTLRQWISRTFQAFYLIEQRATDTNEIRGFIGLYNIRLGMHMTLAAGILDPAYRGQGLGSQALQLFLTSLRNSRAANTIRVEVAKSNLRSVHFFDRLGFEVCQCTEDYFVMNKFL